MLTFTTTTRHYIDGATTCGVTTIVSLLNLSNAMQCRQLALILAFGVSASISWIARPPGLVRPPSPGIGGCSVRKYSKSGCTIRKSGIVPLLSSKAGITAIERPSDSLVNPIIFVIIVSLYHNGFIVSMIHTTSP